MNDQTTSVDMSPEAMDRRLRRLSGLWKLGQSLKHAKDLGAVKDLDAKGGAEKARS